MVIQQVIEAVEDIAPRWYAAEGDNVGFQVGNADKQVRSVLVTLDVTPETLAEAKAASAELIIAHHPLIFQPLTAVTTTQETERLVMELVKSDIALYVAHTNLDAAPGGTSAALAGLLGIEKPEPILPIKAAGRSKVVVFVPPDHVEKVRAAMCTAGAGIIGEYKFCTFRAKGVGSFVPGQAAKPTVGALGKLEEVEEYRLETLVDSSRVGAVVEAVRSSHPYEEPAFDVYPLEVSGAPAGLGRIGILSRPMRGPQLAEEVKSKLELAQVRTIGNLETGITRLAVCSGSGRGLLDETIAKKADIMVTGDIDYHSAGKALRAGLPIIDAGHDATEKPGLLHLADRLRSLMSEVHFEVSKKATNPFGTR